MVVDICVGLLLNESVYEFFERFLKSKSGNSVQTLGTNLTAALAI